MTGSKLTRGGTIAVGGQYAQGRMSGISELSVDQMAVLGLVLRQGRPYSELAGMLDMEDGEMRRRAHEALDALGPDDGARLPAERRAELGDYLLGQQSDEQHAQTRTFLEESPAGRAWARTVADQLGTLETGTLPEVPDGPAEEPPAPPGAGGTRPRPGGPPRPPRGGRGRPLLPPPPCRSAPRPRPPQSRRCPRRPPRARRRRRTATASPPRRSGPLRAAARAPHAS